MTEEGSAVFGARWKGIEAKLIEVPALTNSRPEFKSTYDVEPHAELLGYEELRAGPRCPPPISAAGGAAA